MPQRPHERGQGLVEFAMILPIFLIIVLATIDFGWAFRAYIISTNAAREGARLAVTGASESAIKNRAIDRATGLSLTTGDITVVGAQGEHGEPVTVTVEYDYNYITPLGSLLKAVSLPSPLTMTTSTTMRLE